MADKGKKGKRIQRPTISAKDGEKNAEKPDLGGGSPFAGYRKKARKTGQKSRSLQRPAFLFKK